MKTFKYLFVLFFFNYIVSCSNSQVSNDRNNYTSDTIRIIKLNIKYVDIFIETPISINCDKFEGAFIDVKDTTIVDPIYLNNFQKLLNKLEVNPDGRKPDVRIKINIFFSDGSSACLCLEGQKGAIEYNDKVVNYNEEIASMIYSIMK